MLSFWPTNAAIASITSQGVKGLLAGSTTGNGESELVWVGSGSNCVLKNIYPRAPIDVFDIGVSGKGYIFVGTDPNVVKGNQFYVTDSTGTKLPQPPGGTCCAATSDPSDTATQTAGPPNNFFTFQFTTKDQSSSSGDRTLTFEYSLSGGGALRFRKRSPLGSLRLSRIQVPRIIARLTGANMATITHTYIALSRTRTGKD
jgi:hypothetical protein